MGNVGELKRRRRDSAEDGRKHRKVGQIACAMSLHVADCRDTCA